MYKITVKVDGMACGMCESHINDAVRRNFDVKKVASSHTKGETVIIAKEELEEAAVKQVIDDTGYTALAVTTEPYEKKGLFGRR